MYLRMRIKNTTSRNCAERPKGYQETIQNGLDGVRGFRGKPLYNALPITVYFIPSASCAD